MKEWFNIAELTELALPGLPKSKSGFRRILSTTWCYHNNLTRKVKGAFRPIVEIHISLLPEEARAALLVQKSALTFFQTTEKKAQKEDIWVRYESLSKAHKSRCEGRLKALCFMDDLIHAGMG
ncbi:transposase, partial [Bartonella bacilliformis]